MNVTDLLARLRELDITVELNGEKLKLEGPQAALTPELHAELVTHRDELHAHLRASSARAAVRRMVPLGTDGDAPAFFGVPGHNGDVFCFRPLSQLLAGARPFHGFQPPGVDGEAEPLGSVEALAAAFVESMRTEQSAGPYRIGGYCTGGVIAYEAAQQLLAAGDEVASLVLLGTPSVGGYRLSHRLKATPVRALNKALRIARGRQPVGDRAPAPESREEDRLRVEAATVAAVRRYEPRPYPGRVVLFVPSADRTALYVERYMDWEPLARGGLTVHPGPEGTIHSRMLRAPAVETLAPTLAAELAR